MKGLLSFDLDGTLIDSDDSVARSINYLLKQNGCEPAAHDRLAALVGTGIDNIMAAAGLNIDKAHYYKVYAERFLHEIRLYSDSVPALRKARELGFGIVIATNREAWIAEEIVKAMGLARLVDDILAITPERRPKPAPDLLRVAEERFGLKVDAHIGDHEADMAAAQAYGTLSCCIYRRHNRQKAFKTPPAFTSEDLIDLLWKIDYASKPQIS